MNRFAPILGALGLVVDLAFHWAATADPANVPAVMTTLLVDTDLAEDAWWLTALGVSAHLMFLVAFLYLLVSSALARRGRTTTPGDERGRVGRAQAMEGGSMSVFTTPERARRPGSLGAKERSQQTGWMAS